MARGRAMDTFGRHPSTWRRGAEGSVPMQDHGGVTGVPRWIAELAYEEYSHLYGSQQSFDRLHERGGFGVAEIIALLADRIEREAL